MGNAPAAPNWSRSSALRLPLGKLLDRLAGKREWPALAAVLAVVAGLNLFSLLRTPAPFVDEAWYASRAWSFIQTGWPVGSLDAGVFDRFDGYWTYYPWLGTWVDSQAVRVLGLSLFSVRCVSLLFGLAMLVAIYVIANRYGGSWVGILAVVLVSLSKAFLYSSHLARQDIMVAALGFAAIALYVTDHSSGFSIRSVLSGLAIGLAFEVHANAAIYGPAIVALCLVDYGWNVLRARRLWSFILGVAVGLSFYVAMHILPYPKTYAIMTGLLFGPTHIPPLLVLDPSVWVSSITDSVALFGRARMLLAVGAVAILLARRSDPASRLIIPAIALSLSLVALVRTKMDYYAILVTPAFDILVAACLVNLSRMGWRARLPRLLPAIAASGLVLASLAGNLTPLLRDSQADYRVALDRVAQVVPPGYSVMGSQTYWLALADRQYLSWEQVVYYQRYSQDSTFQDAMRELHPDYFLIDRHLDMFITDSASSTVSDGRFTGYIRQLSLPKSDLYHLLDSRAHLVAQIDTESFGSIRVYKIDWSRSE